MAARSTMTELIQTLKGLTDADPTEKTVGSDTYWSDETLQDVLDQYRVYFNTTLVPYPEYEDGNYVFKRYLLGNEISKWLESVVIKTLTGYVVDSGDYSIDATTHAVTFSANTQGVSYSAQGYAYDMYKAAAHVWNMKAGFRAELITMKSGVHTLYEDQEYLHCMERAKYFSSFRGLKFSKLKMVDFAY